MAFYLKQVSRSLAFSERFLVSKNALHQLVKQKRSSMQAHLGIKSFSEQKCTSPARKTKTFFNAGPFGH